MIHSTHHFSNYGVIIVFTLHLATAFASSSSPSFDYSSLGDSQKSTFIDTTFFHGPWSIIVIRPDIVKRTTKTALPPIAYPCCTRKRQQGQAHRTHDNEQKVHRAHAKKTSLQ